MRWGELTRNVAGLVPLPKHLPAERDRWLTPEQAAALLEAIEAEPSPYALALEVLLRTGLRVGELRALQWCDLDLEARRLSVRRALSRARGGDVEKEPKTPRSRRTIGLTPELCTALKARRLRQLHSAEADYVFGTAIGTAVTHTHLADVFERVPDAAGLPSSVCLHDLRHTAASLLIRAGVPITAVSELLGHSSAKMTLDVYSQALPGDTTRAVEVLADVIERAGSQNGSQRRG